ARAAAPPAPDAPRAGVGQPARAPAHVARVQEGGLAMAVTDLRERYASIVGEDRVITHPEALAAYAEDMTENAPGRADLVLKPTTAEQVQAIVRAAAEDEVPITPAVARMNVGGLAIPTQGGIVLDLTDMNR